MFGQLIERFRRSPLIRGTVILSIEQVVRSVVLFVVMLIVSKGLGSERYGALGLVVGVVGFFNVFASLRLNQALVRVASALLADGRERRARGVIYLSYAACVALGIIAALLLPLLSGVVIALLRKTGRDVAFTYPALNNFIRFYVIVLPINMLSATSAAVLQVERRYAALALSGIVGILSRLLFVLLLIAGGIDGVLKAYIAERFLTGLIYGVIVMWIMVRQYSLFSLSLRMSDVRELGRYALNTTLSSFFRAANEFADLIILGVFVGPSPVAYYRIGRAFSQAIAKIAIPFSRVLLPTLTGLLKGGYLSSARRVVTKASLALAGVGIPITVIVMVFVAPILRFCYGSDEYQAAAYVVRILMPCFLILTILSWYQAFVLAAGRPAIMTFINFFHAVLLVLFCLVGVGLLAGGYIGAAIATGVAQLITTAVYSAFVMPLLRGKDGAR